MTHDKAKGAKVLADAMKNAVKEGGEMGNPLKDSGLPAPEAFGLALDCMATIIGDYMEAYDQTECRKHGHLHHRVMALGTIIAEMKDGHARDQEESLSGSLVALNRDDLPQPLKEFLDTLLKGGDGDEQHGPKIRPVDTD